MKQIMKIIFLITLCVCIAFAAPYLNRPDVNTREGRELILQEKGEREPWKIHSEIVIDGDIVCAIYTDQYDGLAWFHQNRDGKYKWQCTSWTAKGQPMYDCIIKNTEVYEIHWLNRDDVERFEVIFTFGDGTTETRTFDVSNQKMVWYQSPSPSYSFVPMYYDREGNAIEAH